jgi:hypothetical protein
MRNGVDAEMYWVGNEDQGGYGMMNRHGDPWPSWYAKKLCARYVRGGDTIWFPTGESGNGSIDSVVACREGRSRRSLLVVHQKEESASYDPEHLVPGLTGLRTVLRIDEGSGNQIVQMKYDGRIHFDGFGVAAVTTEALDGPGEA